MGVRLERFPEFGVSLNVFSGLISSRDLVEHFTALKPEDADRWVHYFSSTADMTGIDIASIAELKRLIAAKLRELHGERPVVSVLVSVSTVNAPMLDFWRSYVTVDDQHPVAPELFDSLEAAALWLGLSEAERAALARAAEA